MILVLLCLKTSPQSLFQTLYRGLIIIVDRLIVLNNGLILAEILVIHGPSKNEIIVVYPLDFTVLGVIDVLLH